MVRKKGADLSQRADRMVVPAKELAVTSEDQFCPPQPRTGRLLTQHLRASSRSYCVERDGRRVLSYAGVYWRWQRLPFGWSWAPVLAQKEMERLVAAALSTFTGVLHLVYYDDVLLASPNPDLLRNATRACANFLQQHGLLISLHKCVLEPTPVIDWIGKRFQHRVVSNTADRRRQLAGLFAAAAHCICARTLRRLLGWAGWFANHFHGSSRALHGAYLNANCSGGLSWEALWSFALSVTLGCCRVCWSARPTLQILYSDSCAANGTVGVCGCDGQRGLTATIPAALLQSYSRRHDAQQTAELFGVTLAVACAAASQSHLLLLSDSSACVGWFSGLRLPPTRNQARLLLSAAILQTLAGIEVTVRWVPGTMNLADPWSRSKPTG